MANTNRDENRRAISTLDARRKCVNKESTPAAARDTGRHKSNSNDFQLAYTYPHITPPVFRFPIPASTHHEALSNLLSAGGVPGDSGGRRDTAFRRLRNRNRNGNRNTVPLAPDQASAA